jgi:trk system potassium uptake protein TrkH
MKNVRGAFSFYRSLSFICCLSGLGAVPSVLIAAFSGEGEYVIPFAVPPAISLIAAAPALFFNGKREARFSVSQGLLLICLAWFFSCLLGSLPFFISGLLPPADAFFESASGFTTTGASAFAGVESLPRSVLFWRAMTHWIGGMGVVVLTAALAPLLGAGGFQLSSSFQAEGPGSDGGKISPRLSSTAKILWLIYTGLTFVEALLLFAGGMGAFDAVTCAFSTMATGGFTNRNASIGAYNSAWIEWVCIVFMFLAGFNFNLVYSLLRGKKQALFRNSEAKAYVSIIAVSAVACALSLAPGYGFGRGIRLGFFHTLSILTTTGFRAADITMFPPLAGTCLFLLMFIGGCSSSTSGGLKVIRHVILFKQAGNEVKKLLYPRGVFSISLNKREGKKNVVYGVAGFAFLYALLVLAAALVFSLTGADVFSSINIGLLCAGNIGLGFGRNADALLRNSPDYAKWFLSFVMIAGRLELWTVFALFARDWRAR